MPENEGEARKGESQGKEQEEESKFPLWIITLVAGPILLIILIVILASNQPGADGPEPYVFNEVQLKKDANDLIMKASKLYYEAMQIQGQKERDAVLDKALPFCEQGLQKLYEIDEYYQEHEIQHSGTGGRWDWEKTLQEASQLMNDIQKAHGF